MKKKAEQLPTSYRILKGIWEIVFVASGIGMVYPGGIFIAIGIAGLIISGLMCYESYATDGKRKVYGLLNLGSSAALFLLVAATKMEICPPYYSSETLLVAGSITLLSTTLLWWPQRQAEEDEETQS